MKAIGIRSNPKEIFYCIIEKTETDIKIIDIDKVVIPKSMIKPEQLKYIRSTFLDIINEYEINVAGIRITEVSSQTLKIDRLYIEGVILELFASSCLEHYYVGQIANISKYLDIEREDFKRIISGEKEYNYIENFNNYSNIKKESILTAVGALSC